VSDSNDEKIGARTRDLLRSFSDFADMLAVDAPTSVLARQLDELEEIAGDIDVLAQSSEGKRLADFWSGLIADPGKLMRLYELFQHRQAQDPGSE